MEEKKILGQSARPHPAQAERTGGQKRPCLPNPRLDANFKGMFTKDCENSHIALKSFLSAMIGETVTDVIVRENEETSQYKGQKGVRYDINGAVLEVMKLYQRTAFFSFSRISVFSFRHSSVLQAA